MGLKDFDILSTLGKGSFATVYKVRRLNDSRIYAMKQIQINTLSTKSSQNALNEIRFLASFDNPHIVTYHQAFFQEQESLLCIVMEYADDGDLLQKIQSKINPKSSLSQKKNFSIPGSKFPQAQIWKVLISLLNGVSYLHDRSILHRDIKPENIFITAQGQYKLGDLNVSRIKDASHLGKLTQTGTPYYASPEVWNNQQYDEKSDIWSIGCAIYHMAALKPPFNNNDLEKLFQEVTKGKLKPISKAYSNQLNQIIHLCLQKDPRHRPTAKQLIGNWTVKMYNNIFSCPQQNSALQRSAELLKTINMPLNTNLLSQKLPKSNYKNPEQRCLMGELPIIEEVSTTAKKQNKIVYSHSQNRLIKKSRSLPRTELSVRKRIKQQNDSNKIASGLKQNLQLKQIIQSKLVTPNSFNKNKIVSEYINQDKSKPNSLIRNQENRQKVLSRKAIFQRVKSLAVL